jgi:hypothetical protein
MISLAGLVILVLDIIALIHVFQSGMSVGKKALWTLLILVLPLIGMIIYFIYES